MLGTDGFGRSDTRAKLREFFEVDRRYVVLAALRALADEGMLPVSKVVEAIKKYGIDPEQAEPPHGLGDRRAGRRGAGDGARTTHKKGPRRWANWSK